MALSKNKITFLFSLIIWGGGYGLEVPVIYYFTGPGKLVNWVKEKLNLFKQNLEKKNKKMLEINGLKSLITYILMSEINVFLGVR